MTRLWLILISLFMVAAAAAEEGDFRKAEPGYPYVFPRDHGSHPDFKLEWWYLTGHLWTKDKLTRFGFQATFFRAALKPLEKEPGAAGTPLFDSSQAYLAHIALLDVATGKLHVEERLNRQGWDADASVTDLEVRNGNWTLRRAADETMNLQASILADAQIELTFTPVKPKVIFGENGVSKKSKSSDAASHYVTFPRLATEGTVRLLGETLEVAGQAWMDHEFSSSQLGPNQKGWDWASIQLHDGREIMLYRLRDQDGSADPYSQLTWIDRVSQQTRFGPERWEWSARRSWESPDTKATYPIDFDLVTIDPKTKEKVCLRLRPLHDDQEIVGKLDSISYWEGACDVLDESGAIIGEAYVELTGYDGRLSERLR